MSIRVDAPTAASPAAVSALGPPQSDLSVLLVGIETLDAAAGLAPVTAARDNLIAWTVQALRMGVTPDRLHVLCQPALTLADIARAMARSDLPPTVQHRALQTFINHAVDRISTHDAHPTVRRTSSDPQDEATSAVRLQICLEHLNQAKDGVVDEVGPAGLDPWTRRLLDAFTDARCPITQLCQDQPTLQRAFDDVHPGTNRRFFRLIQGTLDLVQILDERGWSGSPLDDDGRACAAVVLRLDRAVRERALDGASGASWATVAQTALALDPGLLNEAPTKAQILDHLRTLAHDGGRGLLVYTGHGGIVEGKGEPSLHLACANLRPATNGQGVLLGGRAYDADGLLGAQDLIEALRGPDRDHAPRWTIALDTCHAGGPGQRLQGSQDEAQWTRQGLHARILAASGQGQRAATANLGDAHQLGAFTWATTTVMSRWQPTRDTDATCLGISNGNLVHRANLLLSALSFNQRVTLSAPEPVSDLPFLGFDPATRTPTDPNAHAQGLEIWPENDEVFAITIERNVGTILRPDWTRVFFAVAIGAGAAPFTVTGPWSPGNPPASQTLRPGQTYFGFVGEPQIMPGDRLRATATTPPPGDVPLPVQRAWAWMLSEGVTAFFRESQATVGAATPLQGMAYFGMRGAAGRLSFRVSTSGSTTTVRMFRDQAPADLTQVVKEDLVGPSPLVAVASSPVWAQSRFLISLA